MKRILGMVLLLIAGSVMAEPEDVPPNDDTLFRWAVKRGDIGAMDWLLAKGVSINGADDFNALEYTIRRIVQPVKYYDAEMNEFWTSNEKFTITVYLLERGANLETALKRITESDQHRMIKAYLWGKQYLAVRYLLKLGFKVKDNILMPSPCYLDGPETIAALVKAGADPNYNWSGMTPLSEVRKCNRPELEKVLIQMGAKEG